MDFFLDALVFKIFVYHCLFVSEVSFPWVLSRECVAVASDPFSGGKFSASLMILVDRDTVTDAFPASFVLCRQLTIPKVVSWRRCFYYQHLFGRLLVFGR
jgi:hypothetical protein